jgi:hypothetical protein
VHVIVTSLDSFDIESVFALLSLTPAEARGLAAKLSKYADDSETMASIE